MSLGALRNIFSAPSKNGGVYVPLRLTHSRNFWISKRRERRWAICIHLSTQSPRSQLSCPSPSTWTTHQPRKRRKNLYKGFDSSILIYKVTTTPLRKLMPSRVEPSAEDKCCSWGNSLVFMIWIEKGKR